MPSSSQAPLLLAALALSACSTELRCGPLERGKVPGDGSRASVATPGSTENSSKGAKTDHEDELPPTTVASQSKRPVARQFVARISKGASCPAAPTGWTLLPPPPLSSTWIKERMARFCAYQLPQGVDTPSAFPSLHAPAGVIEAVAADYAQVLPQGGQSQGARRRGSGAERYRRLRERLGVIFSADALSIPDAHRPYVAIVDTAEPNVSWAGSTTADHHGLIMGEIVSAIRCPDDQRGCDSGRINYEQAFPSSLGGRGSVWSLNVAVLAALDRWRGLDRDTPLVLNMSVGWAWSDTKTQALKERGEALLANNGTEEPAELTPKEEDAGDKDSMPTLTPAEEALFLTLSWASCQRVLAIAAAGNTRGGACTEVGPMAPAAWESLELGAAQCKAMLDPDEHEAQGSRIASPRKLVHAAGGVDAKERPIVNARPLSQPPRVLYASMASVPKADDQYSVPLTGTSVASAALTGIAAQYWGLHPALGPGEVIAAMTGACPAVGGGCARPSGQVPVISGHAVLPQLYEAPPPPSWATPSQSQPLTPSSSGSVPAPASGSGLALAVLMPGPTLSYGSRECTSYAPPSTTSLPPLSWPELGPQPPAPICPTCPVTDDDDDGNKELKIEIAADYQGKDLGSTAVLELFLATGSVPGIRLDLTNPCGTSLSPCTVDLTRYAAPDGNGTLSAYITRHEPDRATLSFYVTDVIDNRPSTQLVGNRIDVFH